MKPDCYDQWLNIPAHSVADETAQKMTDLTMQWIERFIIQPHARLGRPGAVCPFVEPALRESQLYFYITSDTSPDKNALCQLLNKLCDQFVERRQSPDGTSLLSLLVLFPYWQNEGYDLLKEARMAVKSDFLSKGMTLGEFYPGNPDISVRSQDLKIADSPCPMIVLRSLAAHDRLFLQSQDELFAHYLKQFPSNAE